MDMYCIPELRRHEFYLPALSIPSLSLSHTHTYTFFSSLPYGLSDSLTQLLGQNRAGEFVQSVGAFFRYITNKRLMVCVGERVIYNG